MPEQAPLPLDTDACSESFTRLAYQHQPAWFRARHTYEQAMADPSLSICLRIAAEALQRKQAEK